MSDTLKDRLHNAIDHAEFGSPHRAQADGIFIPGEALITTEKAAASKRKKAKADGEASDLTPIGKSITMRQLKSLVTTMSQFNIKNFKIGSLLIEREIPSKSAPITKAPEVSPATQVKSSPKPTKNHDDTLSQSEMINDLLTFTNEE